jgi:hypothetical protein
VAFLISSKINSCPLFCQFIDISATPAFFSRLKRFLVSRSGTIGSCNPADMNTCLVERFGNTSGMNGTIGRNKIAEESKLGRRNSSLAAIFAPFEYPRATTCFRCRLYKICQFDPSSSINSFILLDG